VRAGSTQRRGGIHTDGTNYAGWGGWGGNMNGGGIYLASTDGACRMWTEDVENVLTFTPCL
jgi:hypothetical protein